MNCTSCGKLLPAGVAFCPSCGAPAPYNMPGQGSSSPYAPTEAFSYGNPPSYPAGLPPTVPANPDSYGPPAQNPYTAYGVDTPPQTPYNPYNAPSAYPGNPPPPINQPPSGPYYGPPPVPGMQSGYAPGYAPGAYGNGMPPKKKSKVGWIIGIILLVVVLLCAGAVIGAAQLGKNAVNTVKKSIDATATSATTNTANVPALSNVVPAAAKILYGVQTSRAVDKNYDAPPQQVTTTFAAGKDVNLTFEINSAGKNGFIEVKWYEDGQQLTSDILKHTAINNHGYFAHTYGTAGSGAAAIYWCTQASCSDAQLAQTVSFTITGTGTVPSYNSKEPL